MVVYLFELVTPVQELFGSNSGIGVEYFKIRKKVVASDQWGWFQAKGID